MTRLRPRSLSINRVGATPTNATSVQFAVTFSESVTGVDAGDFALALSGGSTGHDRQCQRQRHHLHGDGQERGSGNGTLGLNLVDDDSDRRLGREQAGRGGGGQRQLHRPDLHDRHDCADGRSINRADQPDQRHERAVCGDVQRERDGRGRRGLCPGPVGRPTGTIDSVSGSGTAYTVTVKNGSGNGTLGLNLVDDDSVVDLAGNKLGGAGAGNGNFTGQTYTIDPTSPVVSDFGRSAG